MSLVAQCHQPTLPRPGCGVLSHELPVPRVSPSTTLSFEGMGEASTGCFWTVVVVEVARVAAAFLPAGPGCRSPSLSLLAARCLPSAGTGVAVGEGRAVSGAETGPPRMANQPGEQLWLPRVPCAGGRWGAGTYSWPCHPAARGGEKPLAWPARLPENRFLPPVWERSSALRQKRAVLRRASRGGGAAAGPGAGPDPASPGWKPSGRAHVWPKH